MWNAKRFVSRLSSSALLMWIKKQELLTGCSKIPAGVINQVYSSDKRQTVTRMAFNKTELQKTWTAIMRHAWRNNNKRSYWLPLAQLYPQFLSQDPSGVDLICLGNSKSINSTSFSGADSQWGVCVRVAGKSRQGDRYRADGSL